MDWTQVSAIIFGNAAIFIPLFLWNRAESREDTRHMDSKLEAYLSGIRQEINAMHVEMKDFHTRLALQDAEFKHHLMMHHDERNKSK